MTASRQVTPDIPGATRAGPEPDPERGTALDWDLLSRATPGACLVLRPDAPRFTIVAATEAYLRAAHRSADELVGRGVFEAFPDANPDNAAPTGAAHLRASLETALRTRAPHRMAVHRYDVQRPDGTWEERSWATINTPVVGSEGEVAYVLHVVEDVTDQVRARAVAERSLAAGERARVEVQTFRAAAEYASDAQYLIDSTGRLRWANRLAAEWLGYTPDELLTLAVGDWNPRVSTEAFGAYFERARHRRVSPFESVHRRKDGSTFPVEITPTVVELPQGARMLAAVRDITERKAAEAERERLLAAERAARKRTEQLQALTAAFSEALTPVDVVRVAVERGVPAMQVDAWLMLLVDASGQTLELVAERGYAGGIPAALRRVPLAADAPLAVAARTGRPLVFRDREERARYFPFAAPMLADYEASVVLPLVARGRTIGALGVHRRAAGELGDEVVAFMEAFARQCAQALDRARAYEAEQDARAEAEAAFAQAQSAYAETAAANRSKSEFLAVMSHELRTPLNAIGGYAELISLGIYGPVTAEQSQALERVQRSQRHLLGLINGVLNYAKIDAGAVHYEVGAVPLGEVLATCEALVAPQVRARGLELRCDGCDAGLVARGDREKVQQVVLNLLSNAVKFTEPGGRVTLAGEAADGEAVRGDAGPAVRVRVADTGRGIPADQLERIFQPFVQVDATPTRAQEGTGLGLAISRDLARGMGGDLTAESTPGAGSTFTLTLPRA